MKACTVDLHMHSSYSEDGTYTPAQLVDRCIVAGIEMMAVTDHNGTQGIGEAVNYARGRDITLVPAVELDCTIDGVLQHMLGYGVDHTDPVYAEIREDVFSQECAASRERMRIIRGMGIDFDEEKLLAHEGMILAEMICKSAMEYDTGSKNPLLDPYRPGGKRSDNPYANFYWDFCGMGKPAYIPIEVMPLEETVGVITRTGGVAVLAHPGNNVHEDTALLDKAFAQGTAGLEAYSSYHNDRQTAFYRDYANRHGLLVTCGSDFHGDAKPFIEVGSTHCEGREREIMDGMRKAIG